MTEEMKCPKCGGQLSGPRYHANEAEWFWDKEAIKWESYKCAECKYVFGSKSRSHSE